MDHHAIVVGGSFAGLSAALQLARARRRVLVIDDGKRRNRFASSSHGFLAQDGASPAEIVREARSQLLAYPTVEFADGRADEATRGGGGFEITMSNGQSYKSETLVLATGVRDILPDVPGLTDLWGRKAFHCPYCHGYELGSGPIAVLASGQVSMHHALMLPDWGSTSFLLNDTFEPDAGERAALDRRGVEVLAGSIAEVADGPGDAITVKFRDAPDRTYAGVFVAPRLELASPLAEKLGCTLDEHPTGVSIRTDAMKATSVPGVFACGDAARMAGNVALAVGDGAIAGAAAHRLLMFGPM